MNGEIIEQLDDSNLVCLNDGTGTTIDVHTGNSSALDFVLVAGTCEWELWETSAVSSDEYPIFC